MNSCYTLLLLHQLRIWTLDWTLHRSKCAGYHYVVMWSCSICITTHITHSKPAVPILCLRAYIIFSCQIIQSHFQPTLFAVLQCCCSCGPVRRSFSLDFFHSAGGLYFCNQHRTWNSVAGIHSGSAHRCKNAF